MFKNNKKRVENSLIIVTLFLGMRHSLICITIFMGFE
jgi:hypothetical protein